MFCRGLPNRTQETSIQVQKMNNRDEGIHRKDIGVHGRRCCNKERNVDSSVAHSPPDSSMTF
ncbi:hypothetical protein PROFUN_15997 [Planoprotostelium fungivorum]|uniref:Uncharacterized protein n=1 Tax=Planoprotostelium fungivorum TaxID=1890364 RepID=A0A2P6MTF4_9EUKA|nr:hypothetical protein PROFUN_15997 [Planoprotostelium fungivorum]